MGAERKFKKEDFEEVLDLAEKIKLVQDNKTASKEEKKKELKTLIAQHKKAFWKMFLMFLKKKLWDERSWSARLALIGLSVGAGVTSGAKVGLATMGFGIGIYAWLLTAAGGAFIGMIIDELKKEKEKNKKKVKKNGSASSFKIQ